MKKIVVFLLLMTVMCGAIDAKVKRTTTKPKTQNATSVVTNNAPSPSIDEAMVMELLNSYVDNKVAERDASRALERLKSVYQKQTTSAAKNEFREVIYKALIDYQKKNKNLESLATIDAYQAFAEPGDSHIPAMQFVKGDISAHVMVDTLVLKDCIAELMIADKTEKTNEYITKLRTYLQEIRDYVPVCDRIGDDLWVSVNYYSDNNFFPYYLLKRGDDGRLALYYSNGALGDNIWAQNQTELMNNCAYLAWSNEKLNMPSNLGVTFRNSLAANVGNVASSALSDALGSSFLGSIGGDLVGGILGSLFKQDPKKVINICEATFHMVNDYEIEANIKLQQIVVSQNKENKEERTDKVLFMRMSTDMYNRLIESDMPTVMIDDAKRYGKDKIHYNEWKKRLSSKEAKQQWNRYQLAYLYDSNEKKIRAQNAPLSSLYHNNKDTNVLGIYRPNPDEDAKIRKKYPNIKGVYVTGFPSSGTAAFYGIKKGDIIQSIDGFEINSMGDLHDYIQSLERFSPVKVKVLRNKKEVEIDVEHIGLYFGEASDY